MSISVEHIGTYIANNVTNVKVQKQLGIG